MFTGLVEGTGTLVRLDRRGEDARMVVRSDFPMEGMELGESVAVDGACLTVTSFQGRVFTADVSAETLERTTLGEKVPGAVLNLERALKVGDRLGGHWVTGHVDTVGTLARRARRGGSWRLEFRFPPRWSPYVVEKGSIAVNGVSLTVNGCGEGELDVNIVPHTSRMTTLESMQTGEKVNLEMDLMGKYVEKMLRGWRKKDSEQPAEEASIDVGFLQKHGFLD